MEPGPPAIAKKLWKIVRIVFFMIRKGISKNKMMVDLRQLMMKRGKLATKAIGNLMFHHHSAFSCRSHDAHLSFVTPREYEFSCSNSPAYPTYFLGNNKRNKNKSHHSYFSPSPVNNPTVTNNDITAVTAVQKLLEMLNNEIVEASPVLPGFGFGRSPMVRQLRITDSPFPLKENEEDSHVDKEAEEFINRFYEQLRQQKQAPISETPRNRRSCPRVSS